MTIKNQNKIPKSGFIVPQHYFDNLEAQLVTEMRLKADVKDTGFKAPDTYFEDLDAKILNKISKKQPKVIPIFKHKQIIYAVSIAALFVLFLGISKLTNFSNSKITDYLTLENYLLNDGYDVMDNDDAITTNDIIKSELRSMTLDEQTFEDYVLTDMDLEELMISYSK